MSEEPHGAHYVWEMMKHKAPQLVAPGLAKQPKGQGIFLIMLVIMGMFGAAGVSYFVYTSYIHPPLQLFGVCDQANETLAVAGGVYAGIGGHVGCFTTVQRTELINGASQVVNVQVPAGSYEYLNGTKAP